MIRCCGGAHGYDNAAPEMRAVFLARGPLFRSDGARLVGELGYESSEAEALVGDDAVTSVGRCTPGRRGRGALAGADARV